ncbi:unnamed protein product [Dracunculus medinensis]|uniref:Peptidyl-prolyl cis-trans isomerase n=1 Tax=Dracunculus medinensis TaxID=318479 RepID=A0A0N4U8V4_DRAME|nr:unnamed protein product [Dracunculus medinensis]
MPNKNGSRVFLDVVADNEFIGRLLYDDICPKTCENFRTLCTNEKGFGYKECVFYRVIPGFCACSGDFETNNEDRTGGRSIFGEKYFEDENFEIEHNARGILSMDNYGWPNTNSSRFFITFDETPWLDEYHVAFGKLVDGWEVLDKIESYGTIKGYGVQKGETTAVIKISDCGELK